jgi:uncharacterized protein YndB with AHSA1/START domain
MNRETFEPGPLADVACEVADERWTLVFVRDLRHPPERVWRALTDPAQLGRWAPYLTSRDLGRPGDVTLTMIDGDTSEELAAAVTRAEPPTLLEYTFGTDLLLWELASTGSGTRLTLRHTVAGPDWLSKAASGWHLCLDVAERLLDGHPINPIRGSDALNYGWADLNDAYAVKLEGQERGDSR